LYSKHEINLGFPYMTNTMDNGSSENAGCHTVDQTPFLQKCTDGGQPVNKSSPNPQKPFR
jgi:hypothetical protein